MKISVIVPTYKRPDSLVRCLRSLVNQTRSFDEIVVVMRDTDVETREAYREFADSADLVSSKLVSSLVTKPGHLPPLAEGLKCATGHIIAVTDDDAITYPDWLQRIESHYDEPSVGGVGGRVENFIDGERFNDKPVRIVGRMKWYGRLIGNMYRDTVFDKPVEVDFLMGGNSSFRRIVWDQIILDMKLNPNVAYNYEVDIGMQAKSHGWRLIFDPQAIVEHHPRNPRYFRMSPDLDREDIYFMCRNLTYVNLKHLKWFGKLAFLLYEFLFGHRRAWGFGMVILDSILTRKMRWRGQFITALNGKIAGVRIYLQTLRGSD